jgi:endonuclease/exonuclease/phosphatase (EEP) superfamily protein YafD
LAVASANVFFRNPDPAPLLAWLRDVRPDVVVIVEITPAFARALEDASVAEIFPHREVAAARDAFGIAVLSRHPVSSVRLLRDEDGVGVMTVRVAWDGREVSLAAVHPMPPQSPRRHRQRNRTLDCLTPARAGSNGGGFAEGPALVVGDFNATPWSNAFAGPASRGWRRATRLAPTWPAAWQGLMGIPIDHVLASPGWTLAESVVGPDIGSDHRPVLVRLHADPAAGDTQSGDTQDDLTSCLSMAPASVRAIE